MRFFSDGPSIPDLLLERCDAGRVVFLCGAGVSLNSGMPTFLGLTEHVIDFFGPPEDSEIMKAFAPWRIDRTASNVPLDQIFNLLHREYGRDEVNALVTERLLLPSIAATIGHEHSLVKRISSNQSGVPQIVTTNFDLLFELGDKADSIPTHMTCHRTFTQPRPEPVADLRLSAWVEQSPGARNFHCVQRVGRLRWLGAGRSLRAFGIRVRNGAARCCSR